MLLHATESGKSKIYHQALLYLELLKRTDKKIELDFVLLPKPTKLYNYTYTYNKYI